MSLDEFSISAMTSYITGLPNTLVLLENSQRQNHRPPGTVAKIFGDNNMELTPHYVVHKHLSWSQQITLRKYFGRENCIRRSERVK
jgi:hypothetical protein